MSAAPAGPVRTKMVNVTTASTIAAAPPHRRVSLVIPAILLMLVAQLVAPTPGVAAAGSSPALATPATASHAVASASPASSPGTSVLLDTRGTPVQALSRAPLPSPVVKGASPRLVARSALLMDAGTGRILYEKNARQRMYPASITKIMTALIALEHGHLDDEVTIPREAAGVEGSSMYLAAGETYTLEELLYGLMLVSGNDAAVAIALHIAGGIGAFAQMMNEKANELGAVSTHFANPHGLPDPNHYTTAYDMALITRRALELPEFRRIVAATEVEIPWRPGRAARKFVSGNWMLGQGGIDGVKTGFTQAARHTYVASATREGRRLIAVVLGTDPKSQKWADAWELLEYGYSAFEWRRVVEAGQRVSVAPVIEGTSDRVPVKARDGIVIPLGAGESELLRVETELFGLEAPVQEGEIAGFIRVYHPDLAGDEPIAVTELLAEEAVERRPPTVWERLIELLWLLWQRLWVSAPTPAP